ncbi:DUF7860 family protein [Halorientalis marina]|jgi:hypothetical protein|uniref:DUF7860 family protein n=1 Tax=Halorientalis marina TaxID=2931976 RepID=UPI001FF617F4|nr:hypothetical protein [Halorientalis marina]
MAGRYGDLDYPTLTKRSVLLGVALFLVGALGEAVIALMGLQVPGWEETLLFDLEVLGIVVAFLSVVVFGVALPLTE